MSSRGSLRTGAWSGLLLVVLMFTGFWAIAGFIPPPDPEASAAEIAAFYREDTTAIRLGLWMTMISAALLAPWTAAITVQLRRVEGQQCTLSYSQLALGAVLILEIIIPLMVWQAAAYRPSGDPETTQRLNDLGWLMFVGVVSTGVLQAVVIGLVILRDRTSDPVFPRWLGYFNFWIAAMFMPAGLVPLVKAGPVAWDGVISWWMLVFAFALWMIVMSVEMLRLHARQGGPMDEDGSAAAAAQMVRTMD